MKRILITGGSGFIGTNLVQHWLDRGMDVLSLDLLPPPNPAHQSYWQPGDITHRDAIVKAVTAFQPDCLYHLAARTDLNGAGVKDYAANTIGVENVVLAAKEASVARVIFASSQLVCRPGYQPKTDSDYCPPNPYGESKVLGEQIVRTMAGDGFTWVLVRPTSIWGPWFNQPYRDFFLTVKRGRYLQAKGIRVHKSFGFVGNTVRQLETLAECPAAQIHSRILYLADYEPVIVSEWARIVQHAWGAPPIHEVPLSLLKVMAKCGDLFKMFGWRTPPISSYRLNNLLTNSPQEMEPLKAICGPIPFTLQEGTQITVDWLKMQLAQEKSG